MVDGHKSAMMWAGHSEHRLFVEALLKPGGIAKIPRGPKTGAKKGVRKATPKKSARLKKMLRAPEMQTGQDIAKASVEDVESLAVDVSSLLPGSLSDPSQRPIVEAAGQNAEDLCVASTSKGHRCKRRHQHGCFCTHHYDTTASQKFMLQLYEQVREPAQDAMASWEQALMDIAVQRSLEENQELKERLARSNALLDARVARLGLRRVATDPFGDCQFLAVIHSAQLPLSAQQLRYRIVQYLKPLSGWFSDRMENQFRGRYAAWCSHMAQPGTWGCELTLLGASHVMRRPVRVITDSEAEDEQAYTRLLTPPPCIDESLWGQEVVVCVSMDRHFDATEPL